MNTKFSLPFKHIAVGSTLAAMVILTSACPQSTNGTPVGAEEAAQNGPAAALKVVLDAAKAGDEKKFKAGLSKNFISVIEEYQRFANSRDDLKGAFDFKVFMKDLVIFDPQPKEEIIKGDKAIVKAVKNKGGGVVQTRMVKENGLWKMEVPPNMAKQLDHIDEIAAMAKGEKVEARPDIKVGGGGSADRVRKLAPTATAQERARATALDAFDLGDMKGAKQSFENILKENPGDQEISVALGRLYVQQGDGAKAVTLFENFLKKDPKAVPVLHYAGMAYMMQNRPAEAATSWEKVISLDKKYAEKFRLGTRVKAAKQIAGQVLPNMKTKHSPSAASQPSSHPASQPK